VLTKYSFAVVVPDGDSDGTVDYKPRGGVPLRSHWFAADLENGSFAVLAPEGHELKHREIESRSVKKDTDGLVEALELSGATWRSFSSGRRSACGSFVPVRERHRTVIGCATGG
jgi:hypothetical protein